MANRLIALQAEKVIVADDHPLFRTAIKEALQASQGETTFLEANSFETLQVLVDENQDVDLVLLDLHMPGVSGFAGLVYLCKRYPSVPVVIISANEDPVVIERALNHGAAGFIPKSSDIKTITSAINDILMGEIWAPVSTQSNLPGKNVSELALAESMAKLPKAHVLLKVSDTGPGIPQDQQEDIFNPFFTTKPSGTGLGLSISHQIIKRQGGTFTLESNPAAGTTFIVELPVTCSKQR